MRDFRTTLRTITLGQEHARLDAYRKTAEYANKLSEIAEDGRAAARLTIQLLKVMALDPLVGHNVEDFLKPSASEPTFVSLRFNRTINLVGAFVISPSTPEYADLVQAVRDNLASRMFKAAVVHRRLDIVRKAAIQRISEKGRKAWLAIYNEATSDPGWKTSSLDHRNAVSERANDASERVTKPLLERVHQRVANVGIQAFAPGYQGSFHEMLIHFAEAHLLPNVLEAVEAL